MPRAGFDSFPRFFESVPNALLVLSLAVPAFIAGKKGSWPCQAIASLFYFVKSIFSQL